MTDRRMSEIDPYQVPQSSLDESNLKESKVQEVVPFHIGLRFANYIIDHLAHGGLGVVVGLIMGYLFGEAALPFFEGILGILVGLTISWAYYFILESSFGVTLGKLVTVTRVVNMHGQPPGIGQVAVRTLCRFIPFEPFSFFGSRAYGWHDSLSDSYVVKKGSVRYRKEEQ